MPARVARRLARASPGSDNAPVQLGRHWSSSTGYTPCSRRQALLPISLIAVVITVSYRAPAVRARPRPGPDWASLRQRSSVPIPMPSSRDTRSRAALSGGGNLATAMSLNAGPYRATLILHCRPRSRSQSDLGIVGCETASAVHFSPAFCPMVELWACKSGKNCPRWGCFSLSTPQARQAPSLTVSQISPCVWTQATWATGQCLE